MKLEDEPLSWRDFFVVMAIIILFLGAIGFAMYQVYQVYP